MLSKAEQRRIHEEETLRSTVRSPKSRGLWALLNQPFALLLISTLPVSVGSYVFNYTKESARAEEVRRCPADSCGLGVAVMLA